MRRIALLVFCVVLASCGKAEEQVTYVLPQAEGGRICTNQCRLAEDYCNEACDEKYRKCVSNAQAQALKDYDTYTRGQFADKQPMDLAYGDFVRLQPCNVTQKSCYNACEGNYGMCYTNCGGKAEVTTTCQFLCF